MYQNERLRIAVLFQRLGPYHHARLLAASANCDVVAVEISRIDHTYAWAEESTERPYPVVTLFDDCDACDTSIAELRLRLTRVLDSLRLSVVAVPGWSSAPALVALDWCVQHGVPSFLMSASTASDEPRRWWREAVKRQVVALSSAALVGGAPQRYYLRALGMATERVFTGYDVVDNAHFRLSADWFRMRAEEERERLGLPMAYFLASSRFIEKKNLPVLLEAYDRYRQCAGRNAWHLVLLGDGPLRDRVEAIIRERDLHDWVVLPGFRQYDQLPHYYGLAGAFVHASTSEQWGLVVNEAMASGLPVLVSSRCGCALDLVADGENGYSFDPTNVDGLAEAMGRLASDDCDRSAMGRRSRQIIARWSPQIFAKGLQDAAAAALAAPLRPPSFIDRALLWALMRR